MKQNSVYIATSLDGFIADKNYGIAWLDSISFPQGEDMGYAKFISGIDALVMGRRSFETVTGFGLEWPYQKPVFVMSNTLQTLPDVAADKATLVRGSALEVLAQIHYQGHQNLYIVGGKTIQGFLREDLIDEMTITIFRYSWVGGFPFWRPRSSAAI